MLQRALPHGRLPERTPIDLLLDSLYGAIVTRMILCTPEERAELADDPGRYAGRIVDFVLGGLPEPVRGPGLPAVRQAASQELGQVEAADLAELLELGAAGEPVGQHHRTRPRPGARRAAGRSRPPPGRRRSGRVPRRSSRPVRSSRRPRRPRRRRWPAARRRPASPSRRAGGSAAGPRRGRRPGQAVSSPGARSAARRTCGSRPHLAGAGVFGQQFGDVAAQHGGARGLQPDDRGARRQRAVQRAAGCAAAGGARRPAGRWRSRSARSTPAAR